MSNSITFSIYLKELECNFVYLVCVPFLLVLDGLFVVFLYIAVRGFLMTLLAIKVTYFWA